MQVKQSTLKKALEFMAKSKTPNSALIPKVSSKFYVGGVPRKNPVVPQNFWADSPLGFWGKIILLAISLFFGLTFMAIFMGEILNILLK